MNETFFEVSTEIDLNFVVKLKLNLKNCMTIFLHTMLIMNGLMREGMYFIKK